MNANISSVANKIISLPYNGVDKIGLVDTKLLLEK